ncbi:MAG: STAS domain-containing protein [Deltaproteobacteria bacterium]|nr:STAS domain-containing protein [Deltaproteobacteria bacterium]
MIDFTKENKTIICKPTFSVIASNVLEMRNQLIVQLEGDTSWEELVLDCEKVETIDSIGVNLIVGLYKKTHSEKKAFKLINCNESLEKILKLFRLDAQFNMESKDAE